MFWFQNPFCLSEAHTGVSGERQPVRGGAVCGAIEAASGADPDPAEPGPELLGRENRTGFCR